MSEQEMKLAEAKRALQLTPEEIEEMEANQSQDDSLPMGKYGILAWDYLKEHHPSRFTFLMLEMTLQEVCLQVDKEANEMMG